MIIGNPILLGGGGGKKAKPLSTLAEGTIVRIKESGILQDYYLAQHDYQPDLNGAGRTLMVRKNLYSKRVWDAGNVNAYATSDIDAWLNGEFKVNFDSAVKNSMGETIFPYIPGNGDKTLSTLQRSIFLLSLTELGLAPEFKEGVTVPIADRIRIGYLDGTAIEQWTRTPYPNNKTNPYCTLASGTAGSAYAYTAYGVRPCFTLPASIGIEPNNEGTYDLVYDSGYPKDFLQLTIEGGTAKPANPKDNTIWVNTDMSIGLTYLTPNAPASPEVGDVWINTTNKYNSNGTNASTNILRVSDNPYLEINVLNISQWDGTAWVTRENSAIYANGAWTNMALYMFNQGFLKEGFTIAGRYSTRNTSSTNLNMSAPVQYGSGEAYLYFGASATRGTMGMQFQPMIDLTNYTKLKIIGRVQEDGDHENAVTATVYAGLNSNLIGNTYAATVEQLTSGGQVSRAIPLYGGIGAFDFTINVDGWAEGKYIGVGMKFTRSYPHGLYLQTVVLTA